MDTKIAKQKLEEEKSKLLEELKELGRVVDPATGEWGAVPEDGGREADENDLSDKFGDYEEKSSLMPTLVARFDEVSLALKKISDETYGTCIVCGKAIEEDRLAANVAATTCKAHMN